MSRALPGVPVAQALTRLVGSRVSQRGSGYTSDVDSTSTDVRSAVATASATPHTAGAWQELIASSQQADLLEVYLMDAVAVSSADSSTLIDIAFGGAGAEVAVISNINVGYRTASSTIPNLIGRFPLFVPAGTRISFRARSVIVSKTVSACVILNELSSRARRSPSALITIGANTATSRGVTLANPGANNTKGAWTEITSGALTQPLSGLIVCPSGGGDITLTGGGFLLDIALLNGSQTIIGNLPGRLASAEQVYMMNPGVHPVSIPAGARIYARWQTGSALSNSLDLVLIGVPG